MSQKQRVIVGVSGGVDSTVAALLLQQQGYSVEALFMKNWEEDDDANYCAAKADLEVVEQICEQLQIKLHTVNFSAEYWDNVFEYFLKEYAQGRTPNPDILCNKEIKFKAFLDYAKQLGSDFIATGHYAGTDQAGQNIRLLKGKDPQKDQSYFLYALNQTQLKHAIFPLAEFNKSTVRAIAKSAGFVNHARKDSTGICFIGERKFQNFLQQYLPPKPGKIITPDGVQLGQHAGLMYYTIGQRHGFGIGGKQQFDEQPWYVVEKRLATDELVVAQGHANPLLHSNGLLASQLHWINPPTKDTFKCMAKIRYRQLDQLCVVKQLPNQRCHVHFESPQRAIAPGQSIVFYQNNICLGGGIIESASELANAKSIH